MFNSSHFLCGSTDQAVSFGFYNNYYTGLNGLTNQSAHAVAVGNNSGQFNQGSFSIAIGYQSGQFNQGGSVGNSLAIGTQSGFSRQSNYAIAVGSCAGQTFQGGNAIAIGAFAGFSTQGGNAIALGAFAGNASQSADSVALGSYAGSFKQGSAAIAIGSFAGYSLQGVYSICIGNGAGSVAAPGNTIILNAKASTLNPTYQNAFYVSSLRNDPLNSGNCLAYNTATSEITYFDKNTSIFTFGNTVDSASASTGSVIVGGGLGVAGNVFSNGMYISLNYFRYVPWTDCGYSVSGVVSAFNAGTAGTNPTLSSAANYKYIYSIDGDMMYLHYSYYSTYETQTVILGNVDSGYYVLLLEGIVGTFPISVTSSGSNISEYLHNASTQLSNPKCSNFLVYSNYNNSTKIVSLTVSCLTTVTNYPLLTVYHDSQLIITSGRTFFSSVARTLQISSSVFGGNGVYYYPLPSGYIINPYSNLVALNTVAPNTTTTTVSGSAVGSGCLINSLYGSSVDATVVPIDVSNVGIFIGTTVSGGSYMAQSYLWNSSAAFPYGVSNIYISWNASFPIIKLNTDSSLVFWYKFQYGDIVSNKLFNYVTGTYDANVFNGASINTVNQIKYNGCLSLNATSSQYIQLPTFSSDLNGMTITCWSKSGNASWSRVFDFGNGSAIDNYVISPATGLGVVHNGISDVVNFSYGNSVWHFFAWTLSCTDTINKLGTWNIYVDNINTPIYSGTNRYYPNPVSRANNYLGKSNWAADAYYTGYMNDFRYYKRILTTTELTNIYNGTM